MYEAWSNSGRRSHLKLLIEGYKRNAKSLDRCRDKAVEWLKDHNIGTSVCLLVHDCQERRV